MNCNQNITAGMVWAMVAGAMVMLIVYGIISSNIQQRRLRAERERVMPKALSSICIGSRYNVLIKGEKPFTDVEFEGVVHNNEAGNLHFDERSFVFKRLTGERIFLRQASVRVMEQLVAVRKVAP